MSNNTQNQSVQSSGISQRIEAELAEYVTSDEFAEDIGVRENEYRVANLPLPDEAGLKAEILSAQKSLLLRRIRCEKTGHTLTDHADGENGCGTLECGRCDFFHNYQW